MAASITKTDNMCLLMEEQDPLMKQSNQKSNSNLIKPLDLYTFIGNSVEQSTC